MTKQSTGTKMLSLVLSLMMVLSLFSVTGTVTASAVTAYDAYLNDPTKPVKFNGYDWYIIADNSTALNAGRVTLLMKNSLSKDQMSSSNYSTSWPKGELDKMISGSGCRYSGVTYFDSVADAIHTVYLKDNDTETTYTTNVSGSFAVKLYLLCNAEAEALPTYIRKCSVSWSLRSKATFESYDGMSYVYAHGERIDKSGDYNTGTYGIRPALQLDLSKVVFDSSKSEFTANLPHSHSFTYSASGATITATCANSDNKCDLTNNKVTLTINAPARTVYNDDHSRVASFTNSDAFNAATGLNVTATAVKYVGRAGTNYSESSTSPTNAGKYTAKITVGGATASVDYEIAKANSSINTVPTASAITYGQTLNNSTLSNGTANVAGTFSWADSTIEPSVSDSNNTEYTVVFTPSNTNYNTSTCNVKLTVNKATPVIYSEPSADSITYGETLADSSLNSGSADVDGTFTWTDDTIQPAVSDSGNTEYAVTFTPDDTDNYTTATCNVEVEVNKAIPNYQTPENLTAVCGTRVGDIELPAGFTWNYPDETIISIGSNFSFVTYTPDDTDNYEIAQFISIEVTGTGIHHDEIPATCEENGVVEYWEDGMGIKFSDENGLNPLFDEQDTVIEKLGHNFIHFIKWVWDGFNHAIAWLFCDNNKEHIETIDVPSAIETVDTPDCISEGYIYHVATIDVAGKTYTTVNVETVDQLGHEWGKPEYTWAENPDDGCMAVRVCTRENCGEFEREFAEGDKISVEVIKDATCDEDGLERYTATFSNEAFETQTIDVVIPKTGHSFLNFLKWVWDGFNRAIAWLFCDNNPEHIETVDVPVSNEKIIPATCEEDGYIYHVATIDVAGQIQTTVKVETIDQLGHEWVHRGWSWKFYDEDNNKLDMPEATAVFNCTHDYNHEMSVPADVTKTENDEAITYTAIAEYDGKTYTTEAVFPKETPDEPINTPDEPVNTPDEPVNTPDEPINTPDKPITPPDEPVNTPDEPVNTPDEPVNTPDKPVNTPDEPVEENEYILVNDEDVTWKPGDVALTLYIKRTDGKSAIDKFVGITVNGMPLPSNYYTVTATEDGIKITFAAEALAFLSSGDYTVVVLFTDGQVEKKITISGAEEPTALGLLGDVNGDGQVDSTDALLILRASTSLESFTDIQKLLADVNADGTIDSADALSVLRYSVSLIDNDNIGKPVFNTVA